MFDKIKSRYVLEAQKIMVEVFRITKLYAPKTMIGVTNEDLEYLASNIANEYLMDDLDGGKIFLREAVDEFYRVASSSEEIGIGDFVRICYNKQKQIEVAERSKTLLNVNYKVDPNVAADNLVKIKQMLKERKGD